MPGEPFSVSGAFEGLTSDHPLAYILYRFQTLNVFSPIGEGNVSAGDI